jgi:hypothetical protein
MPFTPFHMGPGLALKAVAGRHLSLMVFGVSQVAMDLEVLVRIVRQDPVLHGFTHTYAGATLVGAVSAVVGKPLSQAILDRIRGGPEDRAYLFLLGPPRLSWRAALVGAFAGTWSHVLLDSFMHARSTSGASSPASRAWPSSCSRPSSAAPSAAADRARLDPPIEGAVALS